MTNLKKGDSTPQDLLFEAYMCRGNVNFVVKCNTLNSIKHHLSAICNVNFCFCDFKALDTAAYLDTLYQWSAFDTETIGMYVGNALAQLVQSYPVEKIHLMGLLIKKVRMFKKY